MWGVSLWDEFGLFVGRGLLDLQGRGTKLTKKKVDCFLDCARAKCAYLHFEAPSTVTYGVRGSNPSITFFARRSEPLAAKYHLGSLPSEKTALSSVSKLRHRACGGEKSVLVVFRVAITLSVCESVTP